MLWINYPARTSETLADSPGRKHSLFSTLQLLMKFRVCFQLPLIVLKLPRWETHVRLSFGAKSAVFPVSSLKLMVSQLWDRSPPVSTGHGMCRMCAQGTLITKDSKIHLSHFWGFAGKHTGSWMAWWSPWACLFAHLHGSGFGMTGTHSRMFTAVGYLPDVMTGFDKRLCLMPHCFLSLPGIISAKAGLYSHAERIFHTGSQ